MDPAPKTEPSATPAPPPVIDTAALAAEIAARLAASQAATPKPPPAGQPAQPPVGPPKASEAAATSPPVDPRLEQVLAEVAAAKREALDARRAAGREAWRRDVIAALTDPSAGAAAVPEALVALLAAETTQADDGTVTFVRDGKPAEVLDAASKAFRPLTIAERVAALRASVPAGFLQPGHAPAPGGRGSPTPPATSTDLQPAYDALRGSPGAARITPELYAKAAELYQTRAAAAKAELRGAM